MKRYLSVSKRRETDLANEFALDDGDMQPTSDEIYVGRLHPKAGGAKWLELEHEIPKIKLLDKKSKSIETGYYNHNDDYVPRHYDNRVSVYRSKRFSAVDIVKKESISFESSWLNRSCFSGTTTHTGYTIKDSKKNLAIEVDSNGGVVVDINALIASKPLFDFYLFLTKLSGIDKENNLEIEESLTDADKHDIDIAARAYELSRK